MAGFGLCGKIVARAGQGPVLERYLLEAAGALVDVDGCHLYLVSRVAGEPDAMWVVEVWEDADAHKGSLELDAVRELIARARPIITSMPGRMEFEPVGGKVGSGWPEDPSGSG